MSLFHKTERAYRQLWLAMQDANVELNETVKLDRVQRFQSPDLVRIEGEAFSSLAVSGTKDTATPAAVFLPPPVLRGRAGEGASWLIIPVDQPSLTLPGVPGEGKYAAGGERVAREETVAPKPDTGLQLVEAPDLRAEVDAVARGIVDLFARATASAT